MIKILFLCLFFQFNIAHAEATFAGELPEGLSKQLDFLTSGAAANFVTSKLCLSSFNEDKYKEKNFNQLKQSINLNVPGQYREASYKYSEEALIQKIKAMTIAYKNKSCEDIENLSVISKGSGFYP